VAQDSAVRIEGLREFRRDLRALERDAPKALNVAFKEAAQPMVSRAQQLTPRRTGRLASSIRATTRGDRLFIGSRLPYASLLHWGGVIRPKGAPITFRRTEFITRAVADKQDELIDRLGDAIEDSARRHDWQ
jgi:phage gpG-like protein